MEYATEGIVLARYDWSESSQILHALTPDRGRVSLLARGIKKPNPSLKGPADLFHRARLVFRLRPDAELALLSRYEPVTGHPGLRESLERLYAAFYLTELVHRMQRELDPAPDAYRILARALFSLEEAGPGAAVGIAAAAELGLLDAAGFGLRTGEGEGPDLVFHAGSGGWVSRDEAPRDGAAREVAPGTRAVVRALAAAGPGGAARIRLSAGQREEILGLLARLHREVLDRPLASEPFLRDVRHGRGWPRRPGPAAARRG
ncbi:MAG: DNA repair protein RecO [Planctomycetota bacterium]